MHPDTLKNTLFHIIDEMAENPSMFAKHPGVDFTRDRKLPFKSLIKFIICMYGGSINKELYDYFGKENPEELMSASAFVQQRDKLIPETFEYIFREFNDACFDDKTMDGYHLYAVDGTDVSVALNKEAESYMPNGGKPFNQFHVNAIFDLINHVYVNALIQPKPTYDERDALVQMLRSYHLPQKSIIIADRGYDSLNLYEHLNRIDGVDYVIRVKNSKMKELRELPMEELDRDLSIELRTTQTKEDLALAKAGKIKHIARKDAKNPNGQWEFESPFIMNLRVVRFRINEDGSNAYETIITSLNRFDFPIEKIKELYGMRWGIETAFRDLKYTVGMMNFHAVKSDSIKQEIFANLIAYNFCERITSHVVIEKDKKRKYDYKIDFAIAVYYCLDFLRSHGNKAPPDLEKLIAGKIQPIRKGRADERKMRPKSAVFFIYRVA